MLRSMSDEPEIALSECAARRKKALRLLGKSIGLLFAGDHDPHSVEPFRPHPHFAYLTGVTDEPGAVLLLDPGSPVEKRRAMLFLRPLNPEIEKWDGYRLEISQALRKRTGFDAIFRLDHLPRILTAAARRSRHLTCLHPLAPYDVPISPDLEVFRKLAERVPGMVIEENADLIPAMRAAKSRAEVAMIQKAIDITALGFEQVMQLMRPGMNEFQVQETLEHTYRMNGSRAVSFPAIVGSGINSTVLHYRANDQQIEEGDLVCVDSGAVYCGYAADITRTLPTTGTFTDRQREVYEIVLRAQEEAIKACRPGATLAEIDRIARAIITKAGYGDYFPHSIGHHLGLETHDAAPQDAPLAPGAVVTIEPGVYIPQEKIGVRIEDDILVTQQGPRNLSKKVPKSVKEIEAIMARHR